MADLNKELAKMYLEQRGFLAAMDVPFGDEGVESGGYDVIGVQIVRGMVSQAVVGVVRGWWHAGSYLTPGLIKSHLQTDRRFLSEAFSSERTQYVREKFGLGIAPIRNVLFFSQQSPGKSEEAERILNSMNVEVVYLEDVVLEVLPKVGKIPLGEGDMASILSMLRFSRLFREMRKAVLEAQRLRTGEASEAGAAEARKPDKRKAPEPQLDFMSILKETAKEDGDEE